MVKFAQFGEKLLREYGRFEQLEKPSISVVIPAHNEAGYIEPAIKDLKIELERYGGGEVIVVCNGCTDKTAEISKKYADRVFELKEAGVGRARNYGASMVKNDVVVFLDADSRVEDGILEDVARSVKKGYVGGMANLKPDTKDGRWDGFYGWTNLWNSILTPLGNVFESVPQTGAGGLMYCTKNMLGKIQERYGTAFNEKMKACEDVDFAKRMREVGWVDFLKDKGIKTSTRRLEKEGNAAWVKRAGRYLNLSNEYPAVREEAHV